jgi:hypothetical protein
MKTIPMVLLALANATVIAHAQTNNVDVKKNQIVVPQRSVDSMITYQTNVPYAQRLGEVQITYGGVIQDLRRGGTRALLEPGTGPARPFENVSVNPRTGRAEGIILFSVKF